MPFPSVSKYAFTNTPALEMTLRLVIPNRSYLFFVFVELHMATLKRKSRKLLREPAHFGQDTPIPSNFPHPHTSSLARYLNVCLSQ